VIASTLYLFVLEEVVEEVTKEMVTTMAMMMMMRRRKVWIHTILTKQTPPQPTMFSHPEM
jgi:hypothetical protein